MAESTELNSRPVKDRALRELENYLRTAEAGSARHLVLADVLCVHEAERQVKNRLNMKGISSDESNQRVAESTLAIVIARVSQRQYEVPDYLKEYDVIVPRYNDLVVETKAEIREKWRLATNGGKPTEIRLEEETSASVQIKMQELLETILSRK